MKVRSKVVNGAQGRTFIAHRGKGDENSGDLHTLHAAKPKPTDITHFAPLLLPLLFSLSILTCVMKAFDSQEVERVLLLLGVFEL